MFRHERPQKGRYRQFHQFGVEALGFPGPDIDVEHLVMCAPAVAHARPRRHASSSSIRSAARRRARATGARLIAYLERHAGSARRRREAPAARQSAARARQQESRRCSRVDRGGAEAGRRPGRGLAEELRGVAGGCCARRGVSFRINPRLVRGLDYYNLTVFEWVSDRLGAQNAVCAGGRYDGLVEQIGGKPTPACGFAHGRRARCSLLLKDGAGHASARCRRLPGAAGCRRRALRCERGGATARCGPCRRCSTAAAAASSRR